MDDRDARPEPIPTAQGDAALAAEREAMITEQIVARGVTEPRLLEALRAVPRHLFVPEDARAAAYEDRPLPIGGGQTISQPYIVAAMTAALAPGPGDRVLEVGTGSGYQAAILSLLSGTVVTIERHPALADRARAVMASLGATNVEVVVGDGTQGYPEQAPYDRIIVTAGAPNVPARLRDQLSLGGRLLIPVGPPRVQQLTLIRRTARGFEEETGESCVFVPLVGQDGWPDPGG